MAEEGQIGELNLFGECSGRAVFWGCHELVCEGEFVGGVPQANVDVVVGCDGLDVPSQTEAASVVAGASTVKESSVDRVFLDAVEDIPKGVLNIVLTARGQKDFCRDRVLGWVCAPAKLKASPCQLKGVVTIQLDFLPAVNGFCHLALLLEQVVGAGDDAIHGQARVVELESLDRAVRDHEAVGANKAEDSAAKNNATGLVVAVDEHGFHSVTRVDVGLRVVDEAKQVLLVSLPIRLANLDGGGLGEFPAFFVKGADNFIAWNEAVATRDGADWGDCVDAGGDFDGVCHWCCVLMFVPCGGNSCSE